MPILKVYATKEERASLPPSVKLIEPYDAFVVLEATPAAAAAIARKFPLEDISDQYGLQFGDRALRPATSSNLKAVAKKSSAPAKSSASKKAGDKLDAGPHHYVVQFVGPIKQSWLAQLRKTGAKLREPMGNFAWVVWARQAMKAIGKPMCAARSCSPRGGSCNATPS